MAALTSNMDSVRPPGPPARSQVLLGHHRQQLQSSGLSEDTIKIAGLYSETNHLRIRSLLGCSEKTAKSLGACLVIPFYDVDGRNGYARIRPDNPRRDRNEKAVKYESPRGEPNAVYIPPAARDRLFDPAPSSSSPKAKRKPSKPAKKASDVWAWSVYMAGKPRANPVSCQR